MKDLKLLASMLLAVVVLLNVTNCQSRQDTKEAVKNSQVSFKKQEGVRFKQELESLNKTNKVPVQIPDNPRIVYATEQDVLELENGIVLFGWPSCPWFRNAITPLLEFAQEEKAAIYYLNIHDVLNPYTAVGIDSIKRISSPTVLFIEKGKGVHKVVSTVVSQTDPKIKLDSTQRKELKQRYRAYFLDEHII